MLDIKITPAQALKPQPDPDKLVFGKTFTDHMFLMDYTGGQGWHDPRVVPYGPLPFELSCMVFHYAQEIFEVMKAYRTPAGQVQLFLPYENAARLNSSCPEIPEEDFVQAVKAVVGMDRAWVPHKVGASLYIRPFIIATDNGLGVHASHSYLFAVICCPVGAYYPEGINPVKIYVEDEDVRAVKGGTGSGDVNERERVTVYQGLLNAGITVTTEKWIADYDAAYQKAREDWREFLLAEGGKDMMNFFHVYSSHPFIMPDGRPIEEADVAASATDTAVYVLGRIAGEGADRMAQKGDYYLTDAQRADMEFLCARYAHVVLVINAGAQVDLSFTESLPAIQAIHGGGQRSGRCSDRGRDSLGQAHRFLGQSLSGLSCRRHFQPQ